MQLSKDKRLIFTLFFVTIFILSNFHPEVCALQDEYNPTLVNLVSSSICYDVFIDGNYAYVTVNDGIEIANISDPVSAQVIGYITINDGAFGVLVQDEIAYITGDNGGFLISDVSDPTNPVILGQCEDISGAYSIAIKDNYAYLGQSNGDLTIIDISSNTEPTLITHIEDAGNIRALAIVEDYLYVGDQSVGLEIYDITNPANPVRVSTVLQVSAVQDIEIHGELALIACHHRGVRILNISNPSSPRVIGSYYDDDDGEALGIAGIDNFVYVADNFQIELLNISSPSNIIEIASYNDTGAAHDLRCDGEYVYIAAGDPGFYILKFGGDSENTRYGEDFMLILFGISIGIVGLVILVILFRRWRHFLD